jgi:hypothetical protein
VVIALTTARLLRTRLPGSFGSTRKKGMPMASIAGSCFVALSALALTAALPRAANAQCSEWSPAFRPVGVNDLGASSSLRTLIVHDDGSGPRLYATGGFTSVGGVQVSGQVARWDGTDWSALGAASGPTNVWTTASFDDGSGPSLFVGGFLGTVEGHPDTRIARWDGTSWRALGAGLGQGAPFALCAFDDGSGPALYAGGAFGLAGGAPAQNIARWNGASWSPVGAGLGDEVRALVVHNDGSGAALYAGGLFQNSGSTQCLGIARWNGVAWTPLGAGVIHGGNGGVNTLASWDDGTGRKLYVGGNFNNVAAQTVPALDVARWDGNAWSTLAGGVSTEVFDLEVYDDGAGEKLFAVGRSLMTVDGQPAGGIAAWDGASWAPLGGGPFLNATSADRLVSLAVYDDGGGAELYAAGTFDLADGRVFNDIAKWDGKAWAPVGVAALSDGFDREVDALAEWDDGGGAALYAAGAFLEAGTTSVPRVARWTGSGWSSLPSMSPASTPVDALAVSEVGGSSALYAAKSAVYRWNGTSWASLPLLAGVSALCSFDDGGGERLFAAGSFSLGSGFGAIAAWNGTAWSPLASGLGGGVNALCRFDDGTGAALYAGGAFAQASGTTVNYVARWNGTSWSALGSGVNFHVYALAVHDDGTGPALYVGGAMTTAGGVPVQSVARWNGAGWSAVGSGIVGLPYTLASFDDGTGPALYCGGEFSSVGGIAGIHLAKWDGTSWTPVGGGVAGTSPNTAKVRALLAFEDAANGPALWVGGAFAYAGAVRSANIAAWRTCAPPPVAFCSGDGSAGACPCGNSGAPGHGCDNSVGTSGATLSASGTTRPDTLVLAAAAEPSTALSIFSQGNLALGSPVPFGDGLRCVGGALKRLFVRTATGGAVSAPAPGGTSITARAGELGDVITLGSTRFYYVYYRDGNPTFCPSGGPFNVGNALQVVW